MSIDRGLTWRVVPIVVGVLAGLTYSDYLIDLVLQPSGVDELDIISHLEAPGAPYAALLRAFDIAAGVLAVALAPFLFRALPRGWWRWLAVALLVVFGISGALTGIIPDPCPDPDSGCGGASGEAQRAAHVLLSGVADISILLCPLVVAAATWRRGPRWVAVASGAAFALMVLASLIYRMHSSLDPTWSIGVGQRMLVSTVSVCLVVLGVISGRRSDPDDEGRAGRASRRRPPGTRSRG